MQRGHCGKWISAEKIVERTPEASPEVLTGLDHDPAHPRHVAGLSRPPRRRRRNRPVRDEPEIEHRGHHAGGARKMPPMAYEDVERRAVRDDEPAPVHPRQRQVVRAYLTGAAERSL